MVKVMVRVRVKVRVMVMVNVRVKVRVMVMVMVMVMVRVRVRVMVKVKVKLKEVDKMSRTIEVSEETYEKIKDQIGEEEITEVEELDDMIGKKFFFRTVTYHMTGEVVKRIGHILELKNAAWIADSGRFEQAIKEGNLSEVEPVGQAFINLDSVVDFFPWKHKLPNKQK